MVERHTKLATYHQDDKAILDHETIAADFVVVVITAIGWLLWQFGDAVFFNSDDVDIDDVGVLL